MRGSDVDKAPEEVPLGRALSLLRAFYRFTRPHTVLGTTMIDSNLTKYLPIHPPNP